MTLLTAQGVARMLNVTRPTVYNLVKKYGFPTGYKLGKSRRWGQEEVISWIKENPKQRTKER